MGRVCSQNGGRYECFKNFKGKPTGKRPVGRPRRTWEDNTRRYLKEVVISTRNWVDSDQDRDYWKTLENAASNLRII